MYGGPPMSGGGGGGGQYPTPLGPPRGPALGFDNLASQPPMGTSGVSTRNQRLAIRLLLFRGLLYYVNPLTPVPAITGCDEHWSLFQL